MASTTTKEELKAPDAFQSTTLKLWEQVAAHAKEIGIGLVVLTVALVAYAGITAHRASASAEAGAALAKALTVAQRPVTKEEPTEPVTDPEDQPFKTEADQQNALVSALTEVRQKHPDSPAALAALLPLGDAQFKLGKYDEAKKAYDELASKGDKSQPLPAMAMLGAAKALEAKGDQAGAYSAYEALINSAPHAFLKDEASLGKARTLEAQGKKQEAADAFQAVKEGYPNTEASRSAAERLTLLAAAGVKPSHVAAPVAADGGALPTSKKE